jgi:hypothetical protein
MKNPVPYDAYVKYKKDKDLDTYEKQRRSRNYFKKVDMHGYEPDNKINSYHVVDEEECMDKCIEESCESLQYIQVPKSGPLGSSASSTIPWRNVENTQREIEQLKNRKYTDCFPNDYEDYEYMKRRINMECKKKYGDGYLFVNDLSVLDSILQCSDSDTPSIKGECTMKWNDTVPMEFFENQMSNPMSNPTSKSMYIFFMILVLFIFGIFICLSSIKR